MRLALACVCGLLASWALEWLLLRPRPLVPWQRPALALGLHAATWSAAFALLLALLRRPWCASAHVLALQGVFLIVNRAKYHTLREPFVWPDMVFFTDALRHPRLYLPFLGWKTPLVLALGYALALWAGWVFEAPLSLNGWALWLLVALSLLTWLALWQRLKSGALARVVQFDAAADVRQCGLIAALCQYAAAERADAHAIRASAPFAVLPKPAATAARDLPDLVAIQSESFFDPRRCYPQVQADVLAHYDALRAQAAQHGPLRVDAWGANTVRAEFGFLSALMPEQMGVHRFHPYRKLARSGIAALPAYLRTLGYRCICVHPWHAHFYGRDQVLPLLGFDAFIDIRAFAAAPRAGAYVSDLALAAHVQELLQQGRRQPLYIHAISMENHGPLPCAHGNELAAYLLHLRNADAMFGQLHRFLATRAHASALCLFGDHVPILPATWQQLGAPDGTTDYVLWHSGAQAAGNRAAAPLCVHQLAPAWLAHAGIL